ncbi:hypothetical protein COM08_15460 [Bacillus wiedmannii]|uniref:hypothetical protein n=1 Tax=Bacillus TaxID=1386 RepID=UPI000BF56939|nr:hypothetical protein [Bacillus wiedmannii]PGC17898.1 hypothetical protein COM08_15460 [Bacillus wiedmannii]
MKIHVVHLYELTNRQYLEEINAIDSAFKIETLPIVGVIENTRTDLPSRKKIVCQYKLRPFEIAQKKFDLCIKQALKLNIMVQNVKFTADIDLEIEEEISDAIADQDMSTLYKLIQEVREEEIDIFSLSFFYNQEKFVVSKYAVLEVYSHWNSISEKILNSPLPIIIGYRRYPSN